MKKLLATILTPVLLASMAINAAQTITIGNLVVNFTIDRVWKTQLLEGLDDIDLTLREARLIAAFAEQDRATRPWAVPDLS